MGIRASNTAFSKSTIGISCLRPISARSPVRSIRAALRDVAAAAVHPRRPCRARPSRRSSGAQARRLREVRPAVGARGAGARSAALAAAGCCRSRGWTDAQLRLGQRALRSPAAAGHPPTGTRGRCRIAHGHDAGSGRNRPKTSVPKAIPARRGTFLRGRARTATARPWPAALPSPGPTGAAWRVSRHARPGAAARRFATRTARPIAGPIVAPCRRSGQPRDRWRDAQAASGRAP